MITERAIGQTTWSSLAAGDCQVPWFFQIETIEVACSSFFRSLGSI
jgi:hypothetical protein